MCKVVNLYKEEYDIYIGRPGKGKAGPFGNPFRVGIDGERGECVKLFTMWFYGSTEEAQAYRLLVRQTIKPGMVLGCFCKPVNACHGDVIAEYVNSNYFNVFDQKYE